MARSDVMVRIAGEGGEGVISLAGTLTRSAASAAWKVFTFRSYPAEIKGGLAMMQVRINTGPIQAIGMDADILMAFNQEALDVWGDRMESGGLVLYDPKHCEIPEEYPHRAVEMPLHDTAMSATGGRISKNIVALAALTRMLGIPEKEPQDLIEQRFKHKGANVLEANRKAFAAGFALLDESDLLTEFTLEKPTTTGAETMIISGNQAVSMGAIAAGCNFVAGYPITPATPVLEFMMKYLPGFGGNVLQAEDEIAAIAACLGASYAGGKVMTATSGPGLSLMCELIGMASMSEIPIVIIDVQRSGPGTGMPTKTEQADLMYALYGTTGEAPRIVLAPSSIEDCFYLTIEAFNLAERYQMPVIMLSDQGMAYRTITAQIPDISNLKIEKRVLPAAATDGAPYLRYADTDTGISPMAAPGLRGQGHIASGLEHDESGAPSYTAENREKMMAKRFRKLETLAKVLEANGNGICDAADGAEIGIIGWGSTEGPIREAIKRLNADGIQVAHMHPKVLMPLAETAVRKFLKPLKKVVVLEENHTSQFSSYLKSHFPIKPIEINKCTGLPFTGGEIYRALQEHI